MKTAILAAATGFLLRLSTAIAATNCLPNTLTLDGVAYEQVRWTNATPISVTIFHKSGIATIPMEKLTPDLQKRFGYDPEKAAAYRKAQAEQLWLARRQQEDQQWQESQRQAEAQPAKSASTEKPCDTLTVIFVKKSGWCGSLVRVISYVDSRGKQYDFSTIPQNVFLDQSCYRALDWASGDRISVRARVDGYTIVEDSDGERTRLEKWTLCDLAP